MGSFLQHSVQGLTSGTSSAQRAELGLCALGGDSGGVVECELPAEKREPSEAAVEPPPTDR